MAGTPTHTLRMRPKDGSAPGKKIGVAWVRGTGEDEFFGIVLDPGTAINWRDCADYWISLSPHNKIEGGKDATA